MGKDYSDVNDPAQVIQGVMEAAPAYQVGRVLQMMPETDRKALEEVGGKTIEDYLALPDDRRVEMIDGVFYDMAAPTLTHQVYCRG